MEPPADVRGAVAERVVDLGGRLPSTPDDAPSSDARIPPAVSAAFRRAVRRVKLGTEFRPACDVAAGEANRALDAISGAVRQTYTRGHCEPVSSGSVARRVLRQLRRAFVEELDTAGASLKPGELSRALRALELVAEEMERDETERFMAALGSKEGPQLVVEIAHDMRSPLTAILMLADMLRRQALDRGAEGQLHQLGLIYSAAFGLTSLVNDAIALARGGDRLIDQVPVPFSAPALMHSVADMLRPVAEERRLDLRVTTPLVRGRVGQPVALSRVLLNLGSNALKYTSAGEVAISATDLSQDRVRFEVADTGPGIPADVMPGLFEPFGSRSTPSRGRRFSRTGLGLAICRKLVRDMGGDLQVDSEAARGTRFSFDLVLPPASDCDVSASVLRSPML